MRLMWGKTGERTGRNAGEPWANHRQTSLRGLSVESHPLKPYLPIRKAFPRGPPDLPTAQRPASAPDSPWMRCCQCF